MIRTSELYEWREMILKTNRHAEKMCREYKEKKCGNYMADYYEHIASTSASQLSIIERLIEQSRENEKEQICQK